MYTKKLFCGNCNTNWDQDIERGYFLCTDKNITWIRQEKEDLLVTSIECPVCGCKKFITTVTPGSLIKWSYAPCETIVAY